MREFEELAEKPIPGKSRKQTCAAWDFRLPVRSDRCFIIIMALRSLPVCLLLLLAITPLAVSARSDAPPPLPREFRAAWVASVHNLHWPSKPGLSTAAQQAELTGILDRAAALRLNAIVLQVRPSCDALYDSSLEPWSHYLTGSSGRAPGPRYDPLAFAVEKAHARGLELHAWFNPFRAQASASVSHAKNHVSHTHPSAIRSAGTMKWLDPGLAFSRQHTLAVIRDVVRRYDIDGVHIDDYFYPYPTNPKTGPLPFDDSASYGAYRSSGGDLGLAAWRRQNIDGFVESLYATVKSEKPWVKVGISPFGIYRPGHPRGIEADLDSYEHIFADSRKWLREGWLDYCSPQLYWRIDDKSHSFTALLEWWKSESKSGRHVWPGIASDRVGSSTDPGRGPGESLAQVEASRLGRQSHGHIHWSIAPLLEDRKGLRTLLAQKTYPAPAVVPASPWLSRTPPPSPLVEVALEKDGTRSLRLAAPPAAGTAWWAVQLRNGETWSTAAVRHVSQGSLPLPGKPEAIAVTALDRYGNASAPTILASK